MNFRTRVTVPNKVPTKVSNAFSLIELIIVISVLGILGSFLLPNFSSIQNRAKESSVKSVGHTIHLALESYQVNHGSYPVGNAMGIEELAGLLQTSGELPAIPENPFTSARYSDGDSSGKISYTHSQGSTTYELHLFGTNNTDEIQVIRNQ